MHFGFGSMRVRNPTAPPLPLFISTVMASTLAVKEPLNLRQFDQPSQSGIALELRLELILDLGQLV
jgi:hypothetical protein